MNSEIKPICGLDRVRLADVLPLSAPFTLFVFPTTFCNFRCVYCGHSLGAQEMKKRYDFENRTMEMETYRRVLAQAGEFDRKLRLLSLTGQGEPLLNPNLPQMVALAKKSGIAQRVEIITNASLLTRETASALIESGLDCIRISLQGLSAEKYREICRFDLDFDRFVDNIRWFYAHKKQCQVFVKILDIALDRGEEEKFYGIFGDITDRMYVEHCKPVYSGVEYGDTRAGSDRYGRSHEKREVCPLCFYMLAVFPDGTIVPCDSIYKPVALGNVNEEDHALVRAWNGTALREFQILQLRGKRAENAKCRLCCAPDDVSHPEDVLDDDAGRLLAKFPAPH